MLEDGYIPISRKIRSHPFWREARSFSHFEAWFDMICTARFANGEVEEIIDGVGVVRLQRGELVGSVRYLAKRWGWGEKKVRLYLKRLRELNMVRTHQRAHPGAQPITIITLLKYRDYNDVGNLKGTPRGTPKDTRGAHQGHKEEEGKESISKVSDNTTTTTAGAAGEEVAKEPEFQLSADEPSKPPLHVTVGKELIELWNKHSGLTGCKVISKGRERALRERLKEAWWRNNWKKGIIAASRSDFCTGQNSTNWRANVDWFLRPDTLGKILEGQYGSNKQEPDDGRM